MWTVCLPNGRGDPDGRHASVHSCSQAYTADEVANKVIKAFPEWRGLDGGLLSSGESSASRRAAQAPVEPRAAQPNLIQASGERRFHENTHRRRVVLKKPWRRGLNMRSYSGAAQGCPLIVREVTTATSPCSSSSTHPTLLPWKNCASAQRQLKRHLGNAHAKHQIKVQDRSKFRHGLNAASSEDGHQ